MVHAAIHDALNTIDPRFERYAFQGDAVPGAVPEAAVAAALHDVLVAVIPLFGTPAQRATALATAEADYVAALASIPDGADKTAGIDVGQDAAAAIVALRTDDGLAFINPPYTPIAAPGFWQPTPNPNPASPAGVSFLPAILPGWGNLSPFTLMTGSQFRPDPPPTLDSEEYAAEFDEVKAIGEQFSATRTSEQSEIALFWTRTPSWAGSASRGPSPPRGRSISGNRPVCWRSSTSVWRMASSPDGTPDTSTTGGGQ